MSKSQVIYLTKIILLISGIVLLGQNLHQHTFKNINYQTTHLLIDISNSMNIKNVRGKSRLEIAKQLATQLIQSGQKASLIIFAKQANLLIPPTQDISTLKLYLQDLNSNMLPSSSGSSLEQALKLLSQIAQSNDSVTIFSDFDFKDTKIAKLPVGINIALVGIGNTQPSIVINSSQQPIYTNGTKVLSKRNDKIGKYLAQLLGGKYFVNQLPIANNNSPQRKTYQIKDLLPIILIALGI